MSPKGDIRAASVTVKLDGAGRLGARLEGRRGIKAHFVFDVTGYFVNSGAGTTYYPIDPARVVDSRCPERPRRRAPGQRRARVPGERAAGPSRSMRRR